MKKLIILLLPLLLCSCYDETEPDNLTYVTAVGIDQSENEENYYFTIQFAKTAAISGGASEEGGKGGEIVENIIVEAPTLYSAVNWTNHILSKNLSMSHIKLIVFSKEIAESGVRNLTETIIRSQEIRPNIYFAVSNTKASEYLKNVKPIIEINPAKYYQLLFEKNNYGGIPKNPGYNFIFNQETNNPENVLPIVGVIQEEKSEKSGNTTSAGTEDESSSSEGSEGKQYKNSLQKIAPMNDEAFEYKSKNYIAGELGVEVKNKSEAMGIAIFKGDKAVGFMGSIESLLYNILSGHYNRSYLTFKTSSSEIPITMRAEMDKKTHIKYDKYTNKATIKIFIEGDFVSMAADSYTEKDISGFEKEASDALNSASKTFLERTRDEFGSDIIGVGSYARRGFWTDKQFEEFNWSEKYKNITFDIHSEVKIRRTGLVSKNN